MPTLKNTVAVMITMAKPAAIGDTPEARLRATMEECLRHNILLISDDELFVAAVTAALVSYPDGSEEAQIIDRSVNMLAALTNMLRNQRVGGEVLKDTGPVLPLMRFWQEAQDKVWG